MSKIIYRVWNQILKQDVTEWFLINADGELYIDTINFSDIDFVRLGEKYIDLGLISETCDFYDKRFKKTLKEYSKLQYGFINDGVKYYQGDVIDYIETNAYDSCYYFGYPHVSLDDFGIFILKHGSEQRDIHQAFTGGKNPKIIGNINENPELLEE